MVVVVGAAPADGVAACPPDPEPDPDREPVPRQRVPERPTPAPPTRLRPGVGTAGAGAATAGALVEVDCGPVPGGAPGEIPSSAAISCAPSFSIPSAQMPTPRAPSWVTSCDTS